jgi:hypothetical protein
VVHQLPLRKLRTSLRGLSQALEGLRKHSPAKMPPRPSRRLRISSR